MKLRYLFSVVIGLALLSTIVLANFSDLDSSHENYTAISYVESEGIVDGYSDGTYQADRTINRAEFTKIIVGSVYTLPFSNLVD